MDMKTQESSLWTPKAVAARFKEAAEVARRLPSAKVQGYFNSWPKIVRELWETLPEENSPIRPPLDPKAIDRMLESMRWLLCLDETERHIILDHAKRHRSRIANSQGMSRTTRWRRWQDVLQKIVNHLNGDKA